MTDMKQNKQMAKGNPQIPAKQTGGIPQHKGIPGEGEFPQRKGPCNQISGMVMQSPLFAILAIEFNWVETVAYSAKGALHKICKYKKIPWSKLTCSKKAC